MDMQHIILAVIALMKRLFIFRIIQLN